MLKKIYTILLILTILPQTVFATNEIMPSYDLLQQGIDLPLVDPLLNNMTMNNTIEVHQPLPTDVLSYNSDILNNNINNFQTEPIFQPLDITLNQMNDPTLDLLESTMKDLEELENEKTVLITGYLYKYIDKTDSTTSTVELETSTETKESEQPENNEDANTQESVTESSELSENSVKAEKTIEPTENIKDTQENSEVEKINTEKEEKKPTKKSTTEYYTIVNKTEYIQLIPNNEILAYFFELIADKNILLEFVCEKQENGTFLVTYVSCLEELPEDMKNELQKLEERASKVLVKKGVFIAIEDKIYFLEEENDKIHFISTELSTIEEMIFYLTDKGIKSEIEVLEEEDYLDIISITIPEEEMSEEDRIELELIILFDTSQTYNFTATILGEKISNEDAYIYGVKVDNVTYILNTQNTEIGDVIVANANNNKPFYMEGYLGKNSTTLFYVTYIESR